MRRFGNRWLTVRYEDLLTDPIVEVRTIYNYLGLDADTSLVDEVIDATSFTAATKGRRPGDENWGSFFRKGIAGDWLNYFTDADRHIFATEAGQALVRLGYEDHPKKWAR